MKQWITWVAAAVRVAGWAPVAVFAAHVLASRVLGAYRVFPPLDLPVHLLGGVAITFFFWRSLHIPASTPVVGTLNLSAAALLSFAATGTAAVAWEFAEWFSDRYLGTHAQGGLEDTLLDMLLGILGGLVFVAFAAATPSRSSR